MFDISNLTFRYSDKLGDVLQDISLKLNKGEILALIGHNGAGKSTLMKIICGLLPTQQSTLSYNNKPIHFERAERLYHLKMGYAPEVSELDPDLTAKEIFELLGSLRQMDAKDIATETEKFIKIFDMGSWYKETLAKEYSLGMQKKLSLCIALFGPVNFAILDEPFNGIDPIAAYQFKMLLTQKRDEGCSILLSSHLLEILENIVDKVLILNQGKTIYNDTLSKLLDKYPHCKNLEEIYYHLHSTN